MKTYYAGIFTSTKKMKVDEDLDYLLIVSGPSRRGQSWRRSS